MKLSYVKAANEKLLDPFSSAWSGVKEHNVDLFQTPIGMVQHLSPFMALSGDHGKISHLKFKIAHNEKTANVYVSWKDESRDDKIEDLDQFIDSLAVMFPLTPTANSMTMGDANNPVNAWFWRADKAEPYDVIAHGFGTSKRRGGSTLGLSAASRYHNGRWHVVFQRSLRVNMISHDQVGFKPGDISGIAFAVWDGSNKERSAQKSFSGNWLPFEIDA